MIRSFQDECAEEIFHGVHTHAIHKKFPSDLVQTIQRKLDILNCAESLESLRCLPAMKEEAAVRDAHGKYSIPIDPTWRIAFEWNHGPENIEFKNAAP